MKFKIASDGVALAVRILVFLFCFALIDLALLIFSLCMGFFLKKRKQKIFWFIVSFILLIPLIFLLIFFFW